MATIRSLLALSFFILFLLLFFPILLITNTLTLGRSTNFYVRHVVPYFSRFTLRILGIRYQNVFHTDGWPSQAMVIINHSSTLDILTMFALGVPKVRFVAKWEIQYIPVFFLIGRISGQIFIRRQRSQKAVQTLHKAYNRILRQNLSVMMAPEGSRTHEGRIGPFKKGPFRMAMDLGYPIVPVFFEGNQELSQGGSMVAKSGQIRAHIFPPVSTSQWTVENIDDHIRHIREFYLLCDENINLAIQSAGDQIAEGKSIRKLNSED